MMSIPRAIVSTPNPASTTKRFFEAMVSGVTKSRRRRASSLADVFLITYDGVRIPAVRALLRFNSPYFDKLLASDFKEKHLSEIPVSISETMLREVLEFIYTDDCSIIRQVRRHNRHTDLDCGLVTAVFKLADVGDYVALERLVKRCKEAMQMMMDVAPHFLCLALQYFKNGHAAWGDEIIRMAITTVEGEIPRLFLLEEAHCSETYGILHLDEQAIEDMFTVFEGQQREGVSIKFQALIVWATGGKAGRKKCRGAQTDGSSDCDTTGSKSKLGISNASLYVDTEHMMIQEERREVAKRIATRLDVSNVPPRVLARVIEPSGLVDRDVLYEAYKSLAIEYDDK